MKCAQVLVTLQDGTQVIADNTIYSDLVSLYGEQFADYILDQLANPTLADPESFSSWYVFNHPEKQDVLPTIKEVRQWIKHNNIYKAYSEHSLRLAGNVYSPNIGKQVYDGLTAILHSYVMLNQDMYVSEYRNISQMVSNLTIMPEVWEYMTSEIVSYLESKQNDYQEKLTNTKLNPSARQNIQEVINTINNLKTDIQNNPAQLQLNYAGYMRNSDIKMELDPTGDTEADSIAQEDQNTVDENLEGTSELNEDKLLDEDDIPHLPHLETRTMIDETRIREFSIHFFFNHFPEYTIETDDRGRRYLAHSVGQIGLPTLINGHKYRIQLHNLLSDTPIDFRVMLTKMAKKALQNEDASLAKMVDLLSLGEYRSEDNQDILEEMERIILAKGKVSFQDSNFENKVRQNSFATKFVQQFAKTLLQHDTTKEIVNEKSEPFTYAENAGIASRGQVYLSALKNHWYNERARGKFDPKKAKAINIKEGKTLHQQKLKAIEKAKLYGLYLPIFDNALKTYVDKKSLVFIDPHGEAIYTRLNDLTQFLDRLLGLNSNELFGEAYSKNIPLKSYLNRLSSALAIASFEDNQEYRYKDPHGNMHYGIQLYNYRQLKTTYLNYATDNVSKAEKIPALYDAYPELFVLDYSSEDGPVTLFAKAWQSGKHLHFGNDQNFEQTLPKKVPIGKTYRQLTKLDLVKKAIHNVMVADKPLLIKEGDRPSIISIDFSTETDYKSRQNVDELGKKWLPQRITVDKALPYFRTYLKMEIMNTRKMASKELKELNAVEKTASDRFNHLGVFRDLEGYLKQAGITDSEIKSLLFETMPLDTTTSKSVLKVKDNDVTSKAYALELAVNNYLQQFISRIVSSERNYWVEQGFIPFQISDEASMNDRRLAIRNNKLAKFTVGEVVSQVALSQFMANFEYSHFFLGDLRYFKNVADATDRLSMASSTRDISVNLGTNEAYTVIPFNTAESKNFLEWTQQQGFTTEEKLKWLQISQRNAKIAEAGNIVSVTLEDPIYNMKTEDPAIYSDMQKSIKSFLSSMGVNPKEIAGITKAHTNVSYADSMAIMSISAWFSVIERHKGLGSPAVYELYRKYSSQGIDSFTEKDIDLIRITVLKLGVVGTYKNTENYTGESPQKISPMYVGKQIIFPNIPRLFQGNTKFKEISDFMTNSNVGLVSFKSGVKLANAHTYNLQGVAKEYINNKGLSNVVSYQDLGVQVKVSEQEQRNITKPTQYEKLFTINLYDNGVIDSQFADLEQDVQRLEQVTEIIVNKSMKDLVDSIIGMNVSGAASAVENILENSTYTLNELHTLLHNSLIKAGVTGDIINALTRLKLKADNGYRETVFLEELGQLRDIKSLLSTIFEKRVIKQKTVGSKQYQVSSFITEGAEYSPKPYRQKADGTWLPSQTIIPLPEGLWKYVANKYGTEDANGVKRLTKRAVDLFNNEIQRDQERFESTGEESALTKIRSIYSIRIPYTGPNLGDARQVIAFLPPVLNNMAIVPKFQVSKDGSDFDGDVVTIYGKNYRVVNGELEYIEPNDFIDFDNNMQMIVPSVTVTDEEGAQEDISGEEKIAGLQTPTLPVSDYLYYKALENYRVEAMSRITLHPNNIGQTLLPLDTSMFTGKDGVVTELLSRKLKTERSYFDLLTLRYNIETINNFKNANRSIEIGANTVGSYAIFQRKGVTIPGNYSLPVTGFAKNTPFQQMSLTARILLDPKYLQNGAIPLGSRLNEDNMLKSVVMNEAVNLALAATKEMSQYEANMVGDYSPLLYSMFMMGTGVKKAVGIVNQPGVVEYLNTLAANRGKIISAENSLLSAISNFLAKITFTPESAQLADRIKYAMYGVVTEGQYKGRKNNPFAMLGSIVDTFTPLNAEELYDHYEDSFNSNPKSVKYIQDQIKAMIVVYQINKFNKDLREPRKLVFADRYTKSTPETKSRAKKDLDAQEIFLRSKGLYKNRGNFYPDYVKAAVNARAQFGKMMSQYTIFELPGLSTAHKEFMSYLDETFRYNPEAKEKIIRQYDTQVMAFIMSSSVLSMGQHGLPATNSFTSRINALMYKGKSTPTVAQRVLNIQTDSTHPLYGNEALDILIPVIGISNTAYDAVKLNSDLLKQNLGGVKEAMKQVAVVEPQLFQDLFNLSIIQSALARNVYNLMPMFDQSMVLAEMSKVTHTIMDILSREADDIQRRQLVNGLSQYPIQFIFNNAKRFVGNPVNIAGVYYDVGYGANKQITFTDSAERTYIHESSYFLKNYDKGLVLAEKANFAKGLYADEKGLIEGADLKTKC